VADARHFYKAEARLKNDFDVVTLMANVRESMSHVANLETHQRIMLKMQDQYVISESSESDCR
jgi:hypothetical protein